MDNNNHITTDIKKIINSEKERIDIFRNIPKNKQGFIILALNKYIQEEIINKLNTIEIVTFLRYLDHDEITDIIQNIKNIRVRKNIINKLNKEQKTKVEYLLKFDPKSAAGIMSLDYIQVGKNSNFKTVSKQIRKHEKRTGKLPVILVVDEGYLIGELPVHIFVLYNNKEKIKKHIKKIPNIRYDKDTNEIIQVFKNNEHNKIVVLNEDDSIMGIIYSDDIIPLIQKQSINKIYKFAGVTKEEDVLDSPLTKVKNRYKWLIAKLGAAFLAAFVISLFQDTISGLVLLAAYMPVVADMGGNAGTQTMAVVIRGLTLKEIELKTGYKIITNEIIAALINGVINGVLVALIATIFNKNILLGLIVAIAVIVNLVVAAVFGTVIPLLMKKIGKDPASSAVTIITTATDVFGFFIFLGLASIIL
jgi:magnesium transporter